MRDNISKSLCWPSRFAMMRKRKRDPGRRSDGQDESSRGGGAGVGARGREGRLRRARRRDQSVLRGAEGARQHPPHPGAPRRGRLAHGRRLHPRLRRQYRRVRGHLRPRRHRHDHRPVHRHGGLGADPVHHRPGGAGQAVQGGFPGGRHRDHRQGREQVGGVRARAGAGADGVPAGVPRDAFGPPGPGADRPADRRADGRDRIRRRHLRVAAAAQAGRLAQAGGKGAGDAQRRRAAADRRRRRHHQRRRQRAAGGVCRTDRHSGDSHPDGLGHDRGRSPADGRHGRAADQPSLRQCHLPGIGLRARHRQPLGQPAHRLDRGLYQGPPLRPRGHRADPDRARVRAGLRHRVGCRRGAAALHRGGARDAGQRRAEGPLRVGGGLCAPQAQHAAPQ